MSIEVMKMALETLEDVFGKGKVDVGAINALRRAIVEAEQAQPVAWMMVNPTHSPQSKSLHWEPQQWHITWEAVPLYTNRSKE